MTGEASALTIEQRLRRMEDLAEITRLKTRYTELADSHAGKPHSGDEIVHLFTQDAVWHIVPTGPPLIGHAAIRERFDDATLFPFSYHLIGNPWIEVDGDTARGRWHVVVAFRMDATGPMWVTGYYEDEFVRQDGMWKISSLVCTASGAAPFGQSW